MSEFGESARLKRMAQSDQMRGICGHSYEREKHRTHEVGFFSQGFIVIVCERRVCSVVFSFQK